MYYVRTHCCVRIGFQCYCHGLIQLSRCEGDTDLLLSWCITAPLFKEHWLKLKTDHILCTSICCEPSATAENEMPYTHSYVFIYDCRLAVPVHCSRKYNALHSYIAMYLYMIVDLRCQFTAVENTMPYTHSYVFIYDCRLAVPVG